MRSTTIAFLIVCTVPILVMVGCTDEETVYVERVLFEDPPPEAIGFLGYDNAAEKLTVCGNCHVGTQSQWETTAHSTAWVDLQNSGHAAAHCEGCHTTGPAGNPAVTGGHDATLQSRYDDVQCESCHGPGLTHVLNPDNAQPIPSLAVSDSLTCGECHHGAHTPFVEEWEQSPHAHPVERVLEDASANPATNGYCLSCHSGQGALKAWGIHTTYEEQNDPTLDHLGIVCAVCHDPHSKNTEGQLRFPIDVPDAEQNLCIKCHHRRAQPDLTASTIRGPHSPEGPLVLGDDVGWWPPGFEPDVDRIVSTHGTSANERLCAACHVVSTDVTDPEGVFIGSSTGHSFRAIPCTDENGLPTADEDCDINQRTFAGCAISGCHGTPEAARSAYITKKSSVDNLVAEIERLLLVPEVAADRVNGDGKFSVAEGAFFNKELGKLPGSSTHNPFIVTALLEASIQAIEDEYGVTVLVEIVN